MDVALAAPLLLIPGEGQPPNLSAVPAHQGQALGVAEKYLFFSLSLPAAAHEAWWMGFRGSPRLTPPKFNL